MPHFPKFAGLVLAVAFLASPQSAFATDPSILAPYRYQPAPQQLSPLEQQKALIYQTQIQNQLRTLESQDSKGQLNSFDQRLLLDTRSELFRMKGALSE
jgi:hypothetical protein